MPYIITTTTPYSATPAATLDESHVARRAVATLDEARTLLRDGVRGADGTWWHVPQQQLELPESGGKVGPLPDGTVIEVARVELNELRVVAMSTAELIDFYNAAQEARA